MELGIHVPEGGQGLNRFDSDELRELYELIDEIRAEELRFTNTKKPIRPRGCLTRMRTRLSKVSNLCKAVRHDLLETRAAHEKAAKEHWELRKPEIDEEKAEQEKKREERDNNPRIARYHGSW